MSLTNPNVSVDGIEMTAEQSINEILKLVQERKTQ